MNKLKYLELVSQYLPSSIKSEEELDFRTNQADVLITKGIEGSLSEEEKEILKIITLLIINYESEHYPIELDFTPLHHHVQWSERDGCFISWVSEMPFFRSDGKTAIEALENLHIALINLQETGETLPEPEGYND